MGVAVSFVYADWVAAFPQFAAAPGQSAIESIVLPTAELYVRNDGGGPVTTAQTQKTLLWLMVAHVTQLLYGPNGATPGGTGIVGRINSATQGSVSVGAEFPTTPTNAWFLQTPFGALFWQATAAYRTMRYIPGPRRIFNPWANQ